MARKESRRAKMRSVKRSSRKINAVNVAYVPRGGTRL